MFGVGEIAALGSALSYATAVIFFRVAGMKIPPLPFNVFKTTIALFLFLIILPFTGAPFLLDLSGFDYLRLAISGVVGIAIGDVMFVAALNRIGAGMAAIVGCLYAPFVILVAFLLFGETLPLMGLVGTGLVVLGVLIATGEGLHWKGDKKQILIGLSLGALAEFCMVFAVLMVRDIYREHHFFWVVTVRFAIGGAILLVWGLFSPTHRKTTVSLFRPNAHLRTTLPSSLFGPFLATLLWFLGFKYTLAGKAGVLNQLSSIFTFILAALFLKEPISRKRVIALLLAFAGALIVGQIG